MCKPTLTRQTERRLSVVRFFLRSFDKETVEERGRHKNQMPALADFSSSASSSAPLVALLTEDGELTVRRVPCSRLHVLMGGSLTFVGAIDDLSVVAMGRETRSEGEKVNMWCGSGENFDAPVLGTVLFAGSDSQGNEMDVPVEPLRLWLERWGEKTLPPPQNMIRLNIEA